LSPAPELPRRALPRFVTCLIKGPLGCLAFLFGAAVVVVLLLPPAGGRLADRMVEEWFARRHHGTLELSDTWIGSFYGAQRVDGLILRDPEGEEVLRATLRAPALGDFLAGGAGGGEALGPVEVRVLAMRLVETRDGGTNLARALAERPRVPDEGERQGGFTSQRPIALELWIERLRCLDARGAEEVLDGIALRGTLTFGTLETRLVLDGGLDLGGEPARVHVELAWRVGASEPSDLALRLEGVPSRLGALLVPAVRALAPAAGARLDELACQREGARLELTAVDEGARFQLRGSVADDWVEGNAGLAELELGCAHPAAGTLLARLLPLAPELECEVEGTRHVFALARGRWPLDGELARLEGELVLAPAPARARLLAPLAARLAGAPGPLRLEPRRQTLALGAGRLEYVPFRLGLERGWLELAGTRTLARGELDARLTGELDGVPFDLGRARGAGEVLVLEVEAPPAPAQPPAPEPLTPGALEAAPPAAPRAE
jgi:hypothetical protein